MRACVQRQALPHNSTAPVLLCTCSAEQRFHAEVERGKAKEAEIERVRRSAPAPAALRSNGIGSFVLTSLPAVVGWLAAYACDQRTTC